ncbi:hypothetical protein BANRA_05300 [Klebsiella pneumoniae]|nr:hypothetical protein BANRA_05300 [Klebsiella pneumoniae]
MSEVRVSLLRPFRPRRFHRAGEGLPALCRATRFAPALFVVAAGACSRRRITRLSPFAGAETSTTRLAVQGTAEPFAINFSRPFRCRFIRPKKISRSPPDICTGPCSFTPSRRTALKRVKLIPGGRFSRSPHKVKTAAPATQRVMFFKIRKKKMQDPSLRTYRIAFLGRNASGNLPMFTRVQATTGKRAIKRLLNAVNPSKAGFWAHLKTLPIKLRRRKKRRKQTAGMKKQGKPCFSHAVKIARTVFRLR